ncbi:hypothetical protein YC2023_066310 [Brassica napus]
MCPPAHTGRPCVSVSTHTTSVAVHMCLSALTGRLWLSISTHISTLVLVLSTLTLPVDCSGDFGPRGLSVQYTQDVRGCPSAHTGRPCVSISTHRTSVGVYVSPFMSVSTHTRSMAVHGCPSAQKGRLWLSVCVRVCLSAHTERLWLSISIHISTLVLGLSTLALPVDCSGDFGPRGLSVQYTQDVRGCPPAQTGRLCVSVSTHTMSVGVRQHTQNVCGLHTGRLWMSVSTQDIRVCPSAHTGRLWLSVCFRLCPSAHTGRPWLSISIHISTLDVRGSPPAHTGRPCVSVSTHMTSVAVHMCPSAHIGRPWLCISAHISTLVHGLSTLTLPVDCSGDFRPRGLSVQYTQDVRWCPSAHTGRPCVSVSTNRTSVCVRQHTQDVCGRLCVSVGVCQDTHDVCGFPSVHISARCTHKASVGVRQHTQDVRGCPCVSVCVRQHTQDLSIITHISKLVLGISMLTLPVDCSSDFGPRGLSVQYTQDVHGCPSAHTGRLCVSVSTHRTSLAVRVCPFVSVSTYRTSVAVHQYTYQHIGPWTQHADPSRGLTSVTVHVCPCVAVTTHRTSVAVHQDPYQHVAPWTQHAGPSRGLFGTSVAVSVCPCVSVSTHMTSVAVHQYTFQHVVQTGRPWVSASTHKMSVAVAHTGRPWLSIITHISTLVLGLSTLTLPVDCSGDFGPRGLSVQYTQDVSGCPSEHTGRPCVSVSTHRTSVAVCVCPFVSVSTDRTSVAVHHTHRTSVGVRQDTQDIRGSPCVSVCVRQYTQDLSIITHISKLVLGISMLTLPVDCSGDFGPRGLSVQYTQDVHGCPSEHTGRLCVSVSTHMTSLAVRVCPFVSVSTYRTSVAVHQYTYQHVGPWTQHADPSRGLTSVTVHVCPCVSVTTHRTSVAVHQDPYQHVAPWTQHAGPSRGLFGTSVAVCVCPCVSVSTHMTSVAVHHTHRASMGVRQHPQDVRGCRTHRTSVAVHYYTYQHVGPWTQHADPPVDCSGDFGPRGLSVQYTQDVSGCPSEHTGRPCVSVSTHRTSVAVCVCPFVSVSTDRTSVAVHQYTYQHVVHTGRQWVSASTHKTSVAVRVCPCVSVSTHRTSVAVRVCLCVSVSTYRTSVAVHHSVHTGRPWVSVSTHMTQHADPSYGVLSVQYTQDVLGCPSAHTGRLCVSVSTHRTSLAVRVCLFVSVSTHRTSVAVHQYTYQHVAPWTQHADPSCGLFGTHINTLLLGLSMLALPVDCLGDFGPRGLSVQYTQDVLGCPPSQTGLLWLSVSTHRTSVAVYVCLCVSVSTHRTSVAVHHTHRTSVGVRQNTQDIRVCPSAHTGRLWLSVCVRLCPSAHTGRLWLSISTHISTLVLGLSTLTLPVDCSGDFGPRGLSVQYTQDISGCPPAHTRHPWLSVCVRLCPSAHTGRPWLSECVCVCPSAHTGRPWLSISTHISTLVLGISTLTLPVDCSGDFGPCGLSVQYTQDVLGCPSAHTGRLCVSVSTHRMSLAVRVCLFVSVSTHRTSVAVHQYTYQNYTQDVSGCPSAHTGRLWLSVCVRVCPSAHTGHPWLSIRTHICTLLLGLSTLALPVDCLGDFGPRGLSVQYTQDVLGCPPSQTGFLGLSVSTHRTSVAVCVCLCVSVSTHRTSHAGPSLDCSGDISPRGLSVQYTQDVRGCPPAHTGRPWLSVCVRLCPSAHTGRPWLSISTHISTLVLGLSTLALPVDCSGDFGPRGLSVQYTQDLSIRTHISTLLLGLSTLALPMDCLGDFGPRGLSVEYTHDVLGCPPSQTGFLWLSVSTHRTSVAVCVCLCVSISTHRTSVAVHHAHRTSVGVHQHTQDVRGCPPAHTGHLSLSVCVRLCPSAHRRGPWLSISTHISTLVLGLSTLTLPVDCSGDFGPRGLPVEYRQDVRGCPRAHTGRSWLSVSTHRMSMAVHVSPCVSVSTHRTFVAVHHYTYQHAGPWTQHAGPSRGLFGTSVAVHQYTYQHIGPWIQHAGPSCGLFG